MVFNKKLAVEFNKAKMVIYKEDDFWKYNLNYGQTNGIILTQTILEPHLIRFEHNSATYPKFIEYKFETKHRIKVTMGSSETTQSYEIKRKRL